MKGPAVEAGGVLGGGTSQFQQDHPGLCSPFGEMLRAGLGGLFGGVPELQGMLEEGPGHPQAHTDGG